MVPNELWRSLRLQDQHPDDIIVIDLQDVGIHTQSLRCGLAEEDGYLCYTARVVDFIDPDEESLTPERVRSGLIKALRRTIQQLGGQA
jgi:hypothetical protein